MFLLRLFSRLPFPVLYFLSDIFFVLSFYVVKYRRKLVQKNLKNSFPDKTAEELYIIEKQFYRNLCDYGVETVKLLTISKEEIVKRMKYVNTEITLPYAQQDQSIIFLTSHQFNWEWLLVSGSICLPHAVDFVYQKQSSKTFDLFSLVSRTRFGAYPIERANVARETLKRKNILRAIALVADQYPGWHNNRKYWTNFLHQRTAFFSGISQLAILTQYPAYYANVHRVQRGYYTVELIKLIDPPYEKDSNELIEQYVKATEKIIAQYPSNWLWSHNRWKNRD